MKMVQLRYSAKEQYPSGSIWEPLSSGVTQNLIKSDETISAAHKISIYAPPGTEFFFDDKKVNKIVIGGLGIYQATLKNPITYLATTKASLDAVTEDNNGIIIIDMVEIPSDNVVAVESALEQELKDWIQNIVLPNSFVTPTELNEKLKQVPYFEDIKEGEV